jgi:hypothetical protein
MSCELQNENENESESEKWRRDQRIDWFILLIFN